MKKIITKIIDLIAILFQATILAAFFGSVFASIYFTFTGQSFVPVSDLVPFLILGYIVLLLIVWVIG